MEIIIFSVWYAIGFISYLYFTRCIANITIKEIFRAFLCGFMGLVSLHAGLKVAKDINVFDTIIFKKKEIKVNDRESKTDK